MESQEGGNDGIDIVRSSSGSDTEGTLYGCDGGPVRGVEWIPSHPRQEKGGRREGADCTPGMKNDENQIFHLKKRKKKKKEKGIWGEKRKEMESKKKTQEKKKKWSSEPT